MLRLNPRHQKYWGKPNAVCFPHETELNQLERYWSFLYLWTAELLKVNRTLFCTSSFPRQKKNWLCYQATSSSFFREGPTTGRLLFSTNGCVVCVCVWFTVLPKCMIYYPIADYINSLNKPRHPSSRSHRKLAPSCCGHYFLEKWTHCMILFFQKRQPKRSHTVQWVPNALVPVSIEIFFLVSHCRRMYQPLSLNQAIMISLMHCMLYPIPPGYNLKIFLPY